MENGTPGPHCPGIGHDGAAGIRMCVLGAEHDGECTDVRGESILGLTTAEMVEPDAERCPSTAPSDPTARCVRPVGHNGLHAPRAQLADGTVRWSDPMPDSGEVREIAALACESISAHGDVCTLTNGHPGRHERHVSGERVASWGGEVRCTVIAPGSDAQCAHPVGHAPLTVDGVTYDHHLPGVASWNNPPIAERREGVPVDDDAEAVRALVERALASGRVRISTNAGDGPACRKHSAPVRARFIDLPPRTEQRAVLRVPATVSVPGGFALVVDRFRNSAHRDAEHEMWTAWGELIGAKTVFCYPGELEITDWYDAA